MAGTIPSSRTLELPSAVGSILENPGASAPQWPSLARAIMNMKITAKKWVWTYYPGHCWANKKNAENIKEASKNISKLINEGVKDE